MTSLTPPGSYYCPQPSPPERPPVQTPDYDAEFQRAIEQWRGRYRIKEDDTVMLMLELSRIHQDHWDDIRQRDTVGFLEFRQMNEKQNESMKTFQRHVDTLADLLRQNWLSKTERLADVIT